MKDTYEFDDILIEPMLSDVSSRDDVDISAKLSDNLTLQFPLIASPMVGVVDGAFAHKLSILGGLAIMHRFYKTREYLLKDIVDNIDYKGVDYYGISIGVGEENIEEYLEYNPQIILIDTANGYTKRLRDYCIGVKEIIKKENPEVLLMAGNVVNREGCLGLSLAGVDIVRVGIGGGSPCTTRNQTGIGTGNISAIMNCAFDSYKNYKIIIDGGIKNPGDLVKAIAVGADLGMAGRLFAECYEAPNDGILYGMASRTHMENTKMPIKSVEGVDILIDKKQSLESFVSEFGYGIKSAGTYLNARNLEEIHIHGHSNLVKVSDFAIKKDIL